MCSGPDPDPIPGMAYPPKDFETAQSVTKGHGRIERRTLTASSQLKDFLNWPYLEQVFELEGASPLPKRAQSTSRLSKRNILSCPPLNVSLLPTLPKP